MRELASGPRPMGELADRLACDAVQRHRAHRPLETGGWSSGGRHPGTGGSRCSPSPTRASACSRPCGSG
jgi:hypothetical protein